MEEPGKMRMFFGREECFNLTFENKVLCTKNRLPQKNASEVFRKNFHAKK
jgi:hypothetical protein